LLDWTKVLFYLLLHQKGVSEVGSINSHVAVLVNLLEVVMHDWLRLRGSDSLMLLRDSLVLLRGDLGFGPLYEMFIGRVVDICGGLITLILVLVAVRDVLLLT